MLLIDNYTVSLDLFHAHDSTRVNQSTLVYIRIKCFISHHHLSCESGLVKKS